MVEHSEHGAEACHVCALREIERLRAEVKRLDDGWTDCVWHLQSAHKAMGVWKPALVAAEADRDRLRAALASVVKHWREFGPEHGFDETLERAALAGGAEPPSVLGIPVVVDPTMKPGTWELRPAVVHASDCAVHNEPYKPAGPCNCNLADDAPTVEQLIAISEQQK